MPAAAVIPAPKAYIKVVAVKKLVVGRLLWFVGLPTGYVSGMTEAFVVKFLLHLAVWCVLSILL